MNGGPKRNAGFLQISFQVPDDFSVIKSASLKQCQR